MYGLKQSPRVFNKKLTSEILKIGFIQSERDPCIFTRINKDEHTILLVFVDDLVITSNKPDAIDHHFEHLKQSGINIKNLGSLNWYLGIEITRDRDNRIIHLNQKTYIENMVKKFNLDFKEGCSVPLDPKVKLSKKMEPQTEKERREMKHVPYREAVGTLMFLAVSTRPDIATAVSIVSRYLNNPGKDHWNAVKQIIRYVNQTKQFNLQLGGKAELKLSAYADADWAGCVDSRRSNTGFIIMLGNSVISAKSKRQETPAKSTTDAEYMSLCAAISEVLYLLPLIEEMGYKQELPINVFEDNQSCIAIAKNPVNNVRSKHIAVKYHFIRHYIDTKVINVIYCKTGEMIADIMTKGLPKIQFIHHRTNMQILDNGNSHLKRKIDTLQE